MSLAQQVKSPAPGVARHSKTCKPVRDTRESRLPRHGARTIRAPERPGCGPGARALASNSVSARVTMPLTFDNGGGFNDYFTGFTYGSKLSFKVSFYGPALSAPDEVSTSGSAFSFSMFSDAAGTIPILTSDTVSGFAFTVNVNLDGTTTLANSSAQTTVLPATAATSEPTTAPLIALGIGLCSVFRLILCRHGLMFCRRIGRQFRHGV